MDIVELHRIIALLLQVVNQHMEYVTMLQIPLHQQVQQVPAQIVSVDQALVLVHQTNVVLLLDIVVLPKVFPLTHHIHMPIHIL